MKVEVKYFGMIAEKLGKQMEEISLHNDKKEIDLKVFFQTTYPELKDLTYQIAVDHNFRTVISSQESVKEIALLPPFAGG